jgi:hypothetical protein
MKRGEGEKSWREKRVRGERGKRKRGVEKGTSLFLTLDTKSKLQ